MREASGISHSLIWQWHISELRASLPDRASLAAPNRPTQQDPDFLDIGETSCNLGWFFATASCISKLKDPAAIASRGLLRPLSGVLCFSLPFAVFAAFVLAWGGCCRSRLVTTLSMTGVIGGSLRSRLRETHRSGLMVTGEPVYRMGSGSGACDCCNEYDLNQVLGIPVELGTTRLTRPAVVISRLRQDRVCIYP